MMAKKVANKIGHIAIDGNSPSEASNCPHTFANRLAIVRRRIWNSKERHGNATASNASLADTLHDRSSGLKQVAQRATIAHLRAIINL